MPEPSKARNRTPKPQKDKPVDKKVARLPVAKKPTDKGEAAKAPAPSGKPGGKYETSAQEARLGRLTPPEIAFEISD